MKATNINDVTIMKTHCDWIINQTKEIKAMFDYQSEDVVKLNKTRSLTSIETIIDSLEEIKLYLEEV